MRDPARIDRIIAKLHEAWELAPDQRLAQLVTNAVIYGTNYQMDSIFGIDDDTTEQGLDKMLEDLKHPQPWTTTTKAIDALMNEIDSDPSTR